MFKKAIFIILFLLVSVDASEVLAYKDNNSGSLSKLLSYKEARLNEDLYVSLDLSHVLTLMDERFETDVNPLAGHVNPDKSVVTLSYKF